MHNSSWSQETTHRQGEQRAPRHHQGVPDLPDELPLLQVQSRHHGSLRGISKDIKDVVSLWTQGGDAPGL